MILKRGIKREIKNAHLQEESPEQQSEEKNTCQGVKSPSMTQSRSMLAPSLKSLGVYSDLLSLTTDRPTPSLKLVLILLVLYLTCCIFISN